MGKHTLPKDGLFSWLLRIRESFTDYEDIIRDEQLENEIDGLTNDIDELCNQIKENEHELRERDKDRRGNLALLFNNL